VTDWLTYIFILSYLFRQFSKI